MSGDGLGRKLVVVAAAVGALLLVLRIVGGRDGDDGIEAETDDGIDRVETGRSDAVRGSSAVETGLERVTTDDAGDGTASEEATDDEATDEETMDEEAAETEDEEADADEGTAEGTAAGSGDGDDEVPVEATRGRFADLDLFDYVAIVGAAFEAARDEYRNRA